MKRLLILVGIILFSASLLMGSADAESISVDLSKMPPAVVADIIKAQQDQLIKVFQNWMATDSAAATAAMQNSSLSANTKKTVMEQHQRFGGFWIH